MFKVIIAGGRDFKKDKNTFETLDKILSKQLKGIEVVSGGARGADAVGEEYAVSRGLNIRVFEADWDKYGKSAGYRRNAEMANYGNALIAFWDGASRGTKNMIELAEKKGLPIRVINY
jgi:predicted Rossmann fold nucleotide-binding protein DprA/Smf involved in DNA uptake